MKKWGPLKHESLVIAREAIRSAGSADASARQRSSIELCRLAGAPVVPVRPDGIGRKIWLHAVAAMLAKFAYASELLGNHAAGIISLDG